MGKKKKRKNPNIFHLVDKNFTHIINTITKSGSPAEELCRHYGKRSALKILNSPRFIKLVDIRIRQKIIQNISLISKGHHNQQYKQKTKPTLRSKSKPKQKNRRRIYRDYLKSSAWKRKRKQALKFHGSYCHHCKSEENLHVHHTTYTHIFNEHMEELRILCADCHRMVHMSANKR